METLGIYVFLKIGNKKIKVFNKITKHAIEEYLFNYMIRCKRQLIYNLLNQVSEL